VSFDFPGMPGLHSPYPRKITHSIAHSQAVCLVEIRKADFDPILRSQPTLLAKLSEVEAGRLAANRDAAPWTAAEQAEIEKFGVAGFLRRKIQEFFGYAA
jgi:hypothetical protein